MSGVLEHVLYLILGHACYGEIGQSLSRKEADFRSLETRRDLAADQITQEEQFVGMQRHGRMWMLVAVEQRRQLARHYIETRLLFYLPHHHFTRGLAHVRPAPGHRPPSVFTLPHQQNAILVYHRAAHLDLRGRIAIVSAEEIENFHRVGHTGPSG